MLRSNRPNLGFEEAAIAAVRKWRYEPAMQKGREVEVYFTVVVEFELPEKPPSPPSDLRRRD